MASPSVRVMGAAVADGSGMLPAVLPETEMRVSRVLAPVPPADCWTWTELDDCLPERGTCVARAPPEDWGELCIWEDAVGGESRSTVASAIPLMFVVR